MANFMNSESPVRRGWSFQLSWKPFLFPLVCASVLGHVALAGDWPELRGPNRDGRSTSSDDTRLPEAWSPTGEHLIWRVPVGGLSGPVVLGDRVCLQNTAGEGATLRDRLMCLDANSGNLVWERRFSVTHSDVLPNRAGGASPSLDIETGHVYALTTGGMLAAFTRAGVALWIRDLTQEFGLVITETGQNVSPVVDGPLVIVSGLTFSWGEQSAGAHHVLAFDKRTGDNVWIIALGKRTYDPAASQPLVTDVDGTRLLVIGGSDGTWHAIKLATGEAVWRYEVSRRGLSGGAIRVGQDLVLTHGAESLDPSPSGAMAAINPAAKGELANRQVKWIQHGFAAVSSPVSDGQRIYAVDKSGTLAAFDVGSGKQLWSLTGILGSQSSARGPSLVLAGGKIYIGTEDGRFLILRLRTDGADILSETKLGSPDSPEPVTAGAAVSNGRVYFGTAKAVYAIGDKARQAPAWTPPALAPPTTTSGSPGAPALLQVVPADVALLPGQTVTFRVRLLDARGAFIGEEGPPEPVQQSIPGRSQPPGAQQAGNQQSNAQRLKRADLQWSLEGLNGAVQPGGSYSAPAAATAEVGKIKVRAGALSGEARVRIVPRRWDSTFDEFEVGAVPPWWVNARDKFAVKALEGNKVLVKSTGQSPLIHRARAFAGLYRSTHYTAEADVRFAGGPEMGDGGLIAQGFELVLSGRRERLELQSWQAETSRTRTAPIALKTDTWYRMKLQVELLVDGSVRGRGRAWPVGESEPSGWTVEREDPPTLGQLIGSPGLYGDARSEVYFDNVKFEPNR
jgi:outer membrane protein assembly factor BamB